MGFLDLLKMACSQRAIKVMKFPTNDGRWILVDLRGQIDFDFMHALHADLRLHGLLWPLQLRAVGVPSLIFFLWTRRRRLRRQQ